MHEVSLPVICRVVIGAGLTDERIVAQVDESVCKLAPMGPQPRVERLATRLEFFRGDVGGLTRKHGGDDKRPASGFAVGRIAAEILRGAVRGCAITDVVGPFPCDE